MDGFYLFMISSLLAIAVSVIGYFMDKHFKKFDLLIDDVSEIKKNQQIDRREIKSELSRISKEISDVYVIMDDFKDLGAREKIHELKEYLNLRIREATKVNDELREMIKRSKEKKNGSIG